MNSNVTPDSHPDVMILDLQNAYTADVAAARTIKKISSKCNELDIRLKIMNVNVSKISSSLYRVAAL